MDLQQKKLPEPEVIYEDRNFLVVNKPAGLVVHEARSKKHESREELTLVDWLLKHYPEVKEVGDDPATRPGIVHRLDKETSGVMLVARTQEYFEYLKSLFQNRQIKKTYLALVFGEPDPKTGTIEKPIGIKTGTLKRSVHSTKMQKDAITEYKVLKTYSLLATRYSLVEVTPKTGRTHQIRVHLASIGHPIVGDRLYGPKKLLATRHSLLSTRLMLHALSIEFVTKDGKSMKFEAEPPKEFRIAAN